MARFTPERAAEILQTCFVKDKEKLPLTMKPYFEHVRDDKLRDFYLNRLKFFQDNYEDDLPNYDDGSVRYDSNELADFNPFIYFRSKGNYAFMARTTLSAALRDDFFDNVIAADIESMEKYNFGSNPNYRSVTDSQFFIVKDVLDRAIEGLERMVDLI